MIQMYSTGVGIFIGFAGRVEKRIFFGKQLLFLFVLSWRSLFDFLRTRGSS